MKKLLSLLLGLQFLLMTVSSNSAFAQEDEDIIKNTQTDVLIVAAAGAGGALLGLSTLSFVDKPSNHVSNIWTGGALGIIAGVLFVAYNSAQKGSEDLQSEEASLEFNSTERFAWHRLSSPDLTSHGVQFGTQIWSLNF